MKIVKIRNKFYLRRGWFFDYQYADRERIEEGRNIYWWSIVVNAAAFDSPEEIESAIEKYKELTKKEKKDNRQIVIKRVKL